MADKARSIYDKIINSKVVSEVELGTPEMFTKYVSSPDNASKIYQKLISKGLSEAELGTKDMFVSAIVPKSSVSVKATTTQSPTATTVKPLNGSLHEQILGKIKLVSDKQKEEMSKVSSESKDKYINPFVHPSFQRMAEVSMGTKDAVSKSDKLFLAKETYEKADNVLKGSSKDDALATKLGDFAKQAGMSLFSRNTGTLGISPLVESATYLDAVKKLEASNKNKTPLNEEDEILLDALATKGLAEYMRKENLSNFHQAGKVAGDMVPFIMQMAIGAGGVKALSAGGVEVLEKYLKSAVTRKITELTTKATVKGIAGYTGLQLGRAATGVAASLGATALMPMAYTREVQAYRDEDGNIKTETPTLSQQYLDTAKEVLTEKAGGSIGLIGKNAYEIISKIPGVEKAVIDLSKSGVGKAIKYLGSNPTLSKTGIHGLLGEVNEELDGALIDEYVLKREGSVKEFFTKDNLGVMLLGFAPAQGLSSAKNIMQDRKINSYYKRTKTSLDELSKNLGVEVDTELLEGPPTEVMSYIDRKAQELAVSMRKDSKNNEEDVNYYTNLFYKDMMTHAHARRVKLAYDANFRRDVEIEREAENILSNADQNGNITKVTLSDGRVVNVVAGGVKVNEDGQINFEESSPTLIVADESGKRLPVQTNGNALRVESLVSQTPAQQEVDNVTGILQQKYEIETKYPIGTVVYVTDEQGNIKQNEDGTNQSSTIKDHSEDGVIIDTDQGEINLPFVLAKNSLLTEMDVKERLHTTFTPDTEVKSGNGEGFLYIKGIKDAASNTYEVSMYDNNREFVDTVEMSGKDIYEFGKNKMTEMSAQNEDTVPAEDSKMTEEGEFEQKIEQITFPTKKEGGYDFAQFTPEHHYLFAAKTEGEKVANQDLKTAVYAALGNIQKQQDKINKAPFEKKAALRAELLLLKSKYDDLKALEDKYIPKEEHKPIPQRKKTERKTESKGIDIISNRWDEAKKTEGVEDEIVLANGETIKGRYYLTESTAMTPSHDPETFNESEGFPTVDGRTVNDRDYKNDKNAQTIVSQRANNYDGRAIQTPVIVSKEGVVLSGNDRTMAGQLAAKNNTDTKYVEYVQKYGKRYGFTAEQISEYQHPRIVFVPDVDMPYTTETFAKFNAEDKKTQSKTEQAVKISKTINEGTIIKLSTIIEQFELLSELYANTRATNDIISILEQDGVIGANEIAKYKDGDLLSETGKEFVETILAGSVLKEDAIRVLSEMKEVRQNIVKSIVRFVANRKLSSYALTGELNDAIKLIYQVNKEKGKMPTDTDISVYMMQPTLGADFGDNASDLYSSTVQIFAKGILKGQNELKRLLSIYNQKAELYNAGQIDAFEGLMSKEELLTTVLKGLGHENIEQGTKRSNTSKETTNTTASDAGDRGSSTKQPLKESKQTSEQDKRTGEEKALDESILSQSHNNNPTEKQKETGIYDKARISLQGYNITLETLKGEQRSGTDSNGKAWSITMNNHYGELDGTVGYDGDAIDVFVGPNPKGGQTFVIDQINSDGTFDESKVMLGFDTAEQAKAAYMSNYENGWKGFGSITPAGDNFNAWLYDGKKQRKPFAEYKETPEAIELTEQPLEEIADQLPDVGKTIEKPTEAENIQFQAIENDNKLVVLHNIRAEGVLNVDKLGALPMPSLAITKQDAPLEGYGEITLIGDKRMVDPQRGTRTFGADIYSARYPKLTYQISKQGKKVIEKAVESLPKSLQGSAWNRIEGSAEEGLIGLVDSNALKAVFIAERGNMDDIIQKEESEFSQETLDAISKIKGYDFLDVKDNQEARKQITELYFAERPSLEKFRDKFTDEDGLLNFNLSKQLFNSAKSYLRVAGRIDETITFRNASAYVEKNKLEKEWKKYATDFYNSLNVEEKIFKGFSPSGTRRYVSHTIENVIKSMKTKNLRGAEKFFYGAGSVRAKVAPEFKSISDIKKHSESLMSEKEFEKVKDEINKEFSSLLNKLEPFYKYERDMAEFLSEEIISLSNRGVSESFNKLSDEARTDLVEFIEKIKNAPTGYFEAKPTREVYLSEFTAAIVPEDTDPKVIEVLENAGLKVDRYTDNRAEVVQRVAERENVQFQAVSPIGFYSTVEKALEAIQQERGTKEQFKQMLLKNGAKQAEMDWMGFDELPDKLTKADIQNWIDENRIEVKEVQKGGFSDDDIAPWWNDEGGANEEVDFYDLSESEKRAARERYSDEVGDWGGTETKYSQYVLPGGEKYRELLLTMPIKKETLPNGWQLVKREGKPFAIYGEDGYLKGEGFTEEVAIENALRKSNTKDVFKSSHFDEPNILAHIRFNERNVNGERVLFIEEFQSDWNQSIKKKGIKQGYDKKSLSEVPEERYKEMGVNPDNFSLISFKNEQGQEEQVFQIQKSKYPTVEDAINYISREKVRNEGEPDNPFKKTDQWLNLAARRMMRYAAENGFDRIAWTNGEQQADRYDLSKQVDNITYNKKPTNYEEGKIYVAVNTPSGTPVKGNMTPDEIENTVGKDIAKKIIDGGEYGKLDGLDLKVGGEGMKAFYDGIVPSAMSKLGKPFGAKVESISLPLEKSNNFDIETELYADGTGVAVRNDNGDRIAEFDTIEQAQSFIDSKTASIQQSIPVTDSMKETALAGLPLFHTGNTLIPTTPEEVAATVEQLLKTGLAKEVRMVTPEEIAGILEGNEQLHAVYHGSPHSFDQFSLDHIGTGEGVQAYGWGLYFTDKKAIAESYADNLRPKVAFNDRFTFILDGEKLSDKKRHFIRTYFDSYFENIKDLKERAKFWKNEFKRDIENGYYDKYPKHIYEKDLYLDKLSDEILSAESYDIIDNSKQPTNLYTVELHEGKSPSEYDYLRWDKFPTNKQIEKVLSQAKKEGLDISKNNFNVYNGAHGIPSALKTDIVYKSISGELGSDKEASLFLLRAGIDGIQYPANYTTGKANETDFNYVVFDPSAITIKEKVQFLRTPSGTIYGFVKGGTVYINSNTPNLNTPIHEFGHLWIDAIEGTELYNRGAELVKDTPYWERVNTDPNYKNLSETARIKEAMAMAIGDKGESVKRNLALFARIKTWINDVWRRIGAKFGIQNLTPEQIQNLTFNDFVDIAVSELMSGENLVERNNDPRGGVYNSPEYKTADKVRKILKLRGIDKSFSISDTNFGKSMYFTVYGENYEPKLKIRISDHSVSNRDRIFGEQHESAKSDPIQIANDIELAMFPERYNKIQTGVRYYNKYNNQWITEPVENGKAWVKSYNNEATEKQLDNLNPEKTRIVSKEFVKKSKSGNKVYKVVLGNLTEVGEVPIYKYERKQETEIPITIDVDGEKEKVDLNEVSNMLYKLNKIAKAYGNTSTNNYRPKKPEIQQKYYDLKSDIINKYGVYETTHKTKGGVSNLYRIANNTFHDFVSIDQYVKSNVNSNVLDYSYIGYDNAGLYLQSIYGGNKYRFPLTEKQTEYPQLELDKINNFINKYNELELVEPPKNSDTEISEKEEKSIYEKLLTISERKETPATDNDGSFDGENANILFEPQQLFIDFTKNEIQDETRKAHGNEKNQQESVIETTNNATLLPTNGAIASVSRRTSKRRSILSSKRTVIDGFKESGYVNFNGIQVNTHQDIADLWSVHRSPYIEKTHIIFLKDGVIVGTMAHTAGKIDTAPIASVNEIADYAAQLGAMQIYMLHNHPIGNPTPSLQDMKVTYHIADRLHEYGINVLGQVVVDHDKYSFIDTENRLSLENLNESSLKYALENNTEYYEYKSKKTDFLLDRELVEKRDPQQWLFEYGKKLLSQPEYKAAVVYLSTDPSGKGFVVSAYDVLAENTSKEEILSIVNESLNENIGRNAIIIHDGSIKGGFGKVHAKLLDIISIQTGGFANDFTNDEVSYGEKQTLWISEQQNYQYANEKKALARKEKAKQEVRQGMLNATLPYAEYVEIDHVEESNIIPERPVYVKGESAYDYMQKLKEYEDNLHAVDSGVKEAYQEALANTYSKTQQLKRAHIDEVSPIEELNDFIRKQGGEINADADAYIDYFNSKGRATYFTTKFDTEYMQKLVDTFVQVRKSGELDAVSARWADTRQNLSNYEKMHVYLQAKDIEEGITLGLVDRGEAGFVNSIGITHTEYITMFEKNVSKEHIDAMWKAVNDATRFSLDYQLNADMISKETYDKFTKRQYYVPQREWSERERDERPLDYVKRGGGDNPFNAALKKAKGRKSLASDPLPFIQSIAHSSILSAEKNRTKQAMLKTVKANIAIGRKSGAFDFKQSWLINSKTTDADGNLLYDIVYTLPSAELFAEDRETRKEINKLTKQVLEETDADVIDKLNEKIEELKSNINIATFEVHDNYIRNRTSEEKKQHEVIVISNGDRFVIQYQDEKVANAINRNFNRQTYDNVVMRALNKGTRYMSGILTQYNPVFALWNFARDYQTATISHAVDFGAEYEARFFKNTIISQKAINDYVWKGKFANSETGKNLELFFETGAATGWSYLFRIEQLKRKLKNQIDPSVIRSIYDGTTLPFTVMAKAFSNITEASELSTRFATFKTSLEMGYSPKEAASHAKEVTVNFDRSGSSKFFSGIFAFFNAQIQGTNKQYRQLTRTKSGKYAIPAVAFAFFVGGVVNALLSPDDPDEEKAWGEYDRMNNMLVGNVKIPLTHFYRTFWGMGTQAVLAYQGEKSVEVAMFDGTSNMLSDLFPQTPLSLWELLGENRATGKLEPDLRKYLQVIAPTATVPMVDVMLNKTFTGAPVAREPFSTKAKEYIPDSQLYKRNVHAFFKGATDTWFTKHGGDIAAKTKGDVPWYGDINPSKVQHIAEGYTGGVGKQVLDLTNFIYGIAKEGAFDETKIPVWNRLVKPYREDKVVDQKYWTLKNKVDYYEQSYNAYRKARAEGSSLSDEKVKQIRDSKKHELYLEAKIKLKQMERMMKSERVPSSQDIKELDAYIKQWNKLK